MNKPPKHAKSKKRNTYDTNNTNIIGIESGTKDILIAHNLATVTESTVRITAHIESKNIFNQEEIDSQGKLVGTGFFINGNGNILTCHHVIENAVKLFINVPKSGKKNYRAYITSIYPELDIALLKVINFPNKYFLKMGDSDNCIIGSDVTAVGYPLGSDTTKITKGIISGREDYLIQTDTIFNEGNSGGALLNTSFEVIGVNGSKMTGDSIEGVGYSIPINLFKNVMDMMISESSNLYEDITTLYKPNLYCKFQTLEQSTSRLLCHNYYKNNVLADMIEGYMIISMYKKSPLGTCEFPMKVMDILMEFDERKVDMYGDIEVNTKLNVHDYVLRCKINVPIKIKYFSAEKQTIVNTSITFMNEYLYKIRDLFHPKTVNNIILDGVVISELTIDHVVAVISDKYSTSVTNRSNMYSFTLLENREEPRIFISRVLPRSESIDNKNLETSELAIIKRVNGEHVSTIDDFKSSCEKYPFDIDGKTYVHMEMMNNEHITLCIDRLDKKELFSTHKVYNK